MLQLAEKLEGVRLGVWNHGYSDKGAIYLIVAARVYGCDSLRQKQLWLMGITNL